MSESAKTFHIKDKKFEFPVIHRTETMSSAIDIAKFGQDYGSDHHFDPGILQNTGG